MGLTERIQYARLMMIVQAGTDKQALVDLADAAFRGGVDLLQLRFDAVPQADRAALATAARSIAFQNDAGIIIRDDVETARALGADFLHLSEGGPAAAQAHEGLSEFALVGRSSHDLASFEAALADPGLAYATIAPAIVEGAVAPAIAQVAKAHPAWDEQTKPWFAQGGVTLENLDDLLAAGVRRVCVGTALVDADELESTARAFKDRLRQARAKDPEEGRYGRTGSSVAKAAFRKD